MNRRIILVDFYWTRDKDPRVPLGHASILTALRENDGLDVRSIVVAVNESGLDAKGITQNILREAEGRHPADVDIAFGAYVWGEDILKQVLQHLRVIGFRGRLILGGPQVSYSEMGLEQIYPEADAFVRGYGEEALVQLVKSAQPQSILGVHWAGELDVVGQAAVNLEELPSPWLTAAIPLAGQSFIRWETQRGCPFRCAFCQHREPGKALQRRALDLPRIEAEIALFCESDVSSIAVLDPIFNMGPHAVRVLERFSELGFTGHLSLQCRAEVIDDAFLEAAATLDVCLEFGLQTIHEQEGNAIKRRNQMDRVNKALAAVRFHGLRHEVSLIFGLPLQTLKSFESSVAWCLERQVPIIKAFPLLLLRGTALERDRENWSLYDSGGAMPMVVQSSSFSIDDWQAMARISEALRLTEGNHPQDMATLKTIAASQEPDICRWVPMGMQGVA